MCKKQCRDLVKNTLNPNAIAAGVDQGIDERYWENLTNFQMDKVLDVVRCLKEFSGNPLEFIFWRKCDGLVFKLCESNRGTPKHYSILNVTRNKIAINRSQQEFYRQVYSPLSLIMNKLACDPNKQGQGLDIFIRRLKGDPPRLLGIHTRTPSKTKLPTSLFNP